MKNTHLILMLSLNWGISFGQNKTGAEKLVDEGVVYNDKGDYRGAILRYDQALELDKNNLLALAENAFTLLSLEKYDECVDNCKKAIATHSGDEDLKTVYVTYGNALDAEHKTSKSLKIYDEGIKLFPTYYQLYFNKGISYVSENKYDDAFGCFQKAVMLNPIHASSHNAIARISDMEGKRIPALLAYSRFLVLESKSARARENLANVQKIMKGNVKETGEQSVSISLSPDMLDKGSSKGKAQENNFKTIDLIVSMSAALDYDEKNAKKTEVEKFIRKFETFCSTLKENKKDNFGFYWDYYVPYFVEMKEKNYVETYAYNAFASSSDPEIAKWLQAHESETVKFLEWSRSFEWKSN